MLWLEKFVLPDDEEEWRLAQKRRAENGGAFGYLENGYPCGLFPQKGLRELDFEPITILCGGNGCFVKDLLPDFEYDLGLIHSGLEDFTRRGVWNQD